MFSKSKLNQGAEAPKPSTDGPARPSGSLIPTRPGGSDVPPPAGMMRNKVAPSVMSGDLMVKGDIRTTGDVQIDGEVEGNVNAHLLTIGEGAVVRGEIVADDIVVNGRVIGRVRGLKVRLTSTARVEGDIIHRTIAIESGAHFEGAVQRQDDPLGSKAMQSQLPPPDDGRD